MKQTVKMSRTTGFLEKAFRALNQYYYDGKLEEPIVTVQSSPRSFGHITVGKSWVSGQEWRHELNLSAGYLSRDLEDVIATLQHECIHLYCIANDIQDTSRNGHYHNKRFKTEAEKRDLKISYDKRIGWSITEPTPALCDFIIEQGWTDIQMNRQEWSFTPRGGAGASAGGVGTLPPTGKTSSTRKYVCSSCGQSVRATKTVNIICGDCQEQMIVATKQGSL